MCIHVHEHHHSARHATFFPLARGEMHRRENPGSRGTRFFRFMRKEMRRGEEPRFPHHLRRRDKPTTPVHREVMTPVRAASDFFRFMRGEMRRGANPGSPGGKWLYRFAGREMPRGENRFARQGKPRHMTLTVFGDATRRQPRSPGSENPGSSGSDFLSFSETSCAEAEPPVLSASHLTVFRGVSENTGSVR